MAEWFQTPSSNDIRGPSINFDKGTCVINKICSLLDIYPYLKL